MTKISGTIATEPTESAFFDNNVTFILHSSRRSGTVDKIRVTCPSYMLSGLHIGDFVLVVGQILTYNIGRALFVFLRASDVILYDGISLNSSTLEGTICKRPITRSTPKGRTITEFILAYNVGSHPNYLPCIAWESSDISRLSVGDNVILLGRIQSRDYTKDEIIHTTYEFSVSLYENTCLAISNMR